MKHEVDLISRLTALGIRLKNDNGKLVIRGNKAALTAAMVDEVKTHKSVLLTLLRDRHHAETQVIEAIDGEQVQVPLSFAQQQLWLLDQVDGQSSNYNMPSAIQLEGNAQIDYVRECFLKILQRHKILRTIYKSDINGDVWQQVLDINSFDIDYCDYSQLTEDELTQTLNRKKELFASEPFDLTQDLMIRVALCRLTHDQYLLLTTMHHIAADGWSQAILVDEFCRIYTALTQQESANLEPLNIQYGDFAYWQRNTLTTESLNDQLRYWEQKLSGAPELHGLPLDFVRRKSSEAPSARVKAHIDAKLKDKLLNVCKQSNATLFMGLYATFACLISRYSNEEDVVIGSPIANRDSKQLAPLIGFFVNTLPLRLELNSQYSFSELLEQSKSTLLEAYANQQVPFERIVEKVKPSRSLDYNPLFQVMLVLQNNAKGTMDLPGLQLSPQDYDGNGKAKFDLLLEVDESSDGLELYWEYNSDLFKSTSIQSMSKHFQSLLQGLLDEPNRSIASIELCDALDHQQIAKFQPTVNDSIAPVSIKQLFEDQALKNPQALALCYQDIELSYDELNRRANRLARYLQKEQGLAPQSLVGVCLNRSISMLVSILAVLKSGCAYVSLDPSYPRERLAYILEDSQLACVLSQNDVPVLDVLPSEHTLILDSNNLIHSLASPELSDENIELGVRPDDLAYIIYTSGSTGRPKGVAQTHQTLCNLVQAQADSDGITRSLKTLQFASINFDVSIQEMVTAWYTGSVLQLISTDEKDNLPALLDLISTKSIERAFLPPAVLHLLVDQYVKARNKSISLREIFVAGEALLGSENLDVFLDSNPHCVLWNHYGPTETHVVTRHRYTVGERRVPIGRVVPGFHAQVVNAQGLVSPIGVPGELRLSGLGLARGYINADALSAEKFTETSPGSKYSRQYRTGDLVRWLDDGKLEYLGRLDQQVKIRGFRVELGELELCLKRHPGVQDALVVVHNNQLSAYIIHSQEVSAPETSELSNSLRSFIATELPSYMLPSSISTLKQWPLTANGKIDKRALPKPEFSEGNVDYVAPQTENERVLCRIWQETLSQDRIGIDDNFFELGGHSLSATRVVAAVNQHFNKSLPLKTLFEHQTVSGFARAMTGNLSENLTIFPVSRDDALLSSFAQRRLWLLDKIEGSNAHYNLSNTLRLDGQLNRPALTKAFLQIVQRHESLRTRFVVGEDGEPYQDIGSADVFRVQFDDLSQVDQKEKQECIRAIVREEDATHFDLSRDLMLRVRLIKSSENEHYLCVTFHHIASDGWSFGILIEEFKAIYSAIINGLDAALSPLRIQYADYSAWQRAYLQGEQLNRHLLYWSQALEGIPELHSLPLDHARPKQQSFNGRYFHQSLPSDLSRDLKQLCQREGVTLFMALHSVFSVLLARHSNERDIIVGSPIANREQSELEPLIGFFVNTLVLRSKLEGNPSFSELLQNSKHTLINAYEHQQVPFELLVERLQPERSLSHSPLFQIMLVLQNTEQGSLDLPELKLSPFPGADEQCVAKFDLLLNIQENKDSLELVWEYNCDLFERTTISTLAEHFNSLLHACVRDPKQKALSAAMLSESEEKYLLGLSNHSDVLDPAELECDLLHQFVEQQALHTPEATAVVCGAQSLNYREFNERANQLAAYLQKHRNVGIESLVGVCMDRSLDMLLSIVAILKAGGAYIPLDPEYPAARIAYMLEDAQLQSVLTRTTLLEGSPIRRDQAVCLDDSDLQDLLSGLSPKNLELSESNGERLAYVIYTSGSTGKPKGVMIEHRNAVAFIQWAKQAFTQAQLSNVLASTSMCFDLSIFEFFAPLSVGGTSTIVTNILELTEKTWSKEITLINTVPSAADLLLATGDIPNSVNTINLAGEPLKQSLVDRLYEQGIEAVYDLYGPSEDTTYSTYCLRKQKGRASIGKPISYTQAYILNEALGLAPLGTIGELYLGGAGVSRGYLHQDKLTYERYIESPFVTDKKTKAAARLYKTGDLVRWNTTGQLEYLGRIDHQVKIRGFRIELGEIENAIMAHSSVKEALVIAKQVRAEDQQLIAYIVAKTKTVSEDLLGSLKNELSTSLPDYMIPALFVSLKSMPLTPNGKIDRKALPDPDFSKEQSNYQAPRNAIEEDLAAIWLGLLNLEQVGIYDNFFHLGGHSLLATRLAAQIQSHFNVTLPLKTLFATQDLASLADSIAHAENSEERPHLVPVSREQALPVSYSQQRLWLLDQIDGGSAHYNMPSVLRLEGELDYEAMAKAFNTIVERHESLRTNFDSDDEGQALQKIQAPRAVPIEQHDLTGLKGKEQELAVVQRASEEACRNFNLRADLMLRVQLLKLSQHEHIVLVTLHHIASDGWSIGLLIKEFTALYSAYVKGEASPLKPLDIQYADYAHWQRQWLQGELLEQQLNYWATQLSGLPVVHNLPLDRPRPSRQSFNGASITSLVNRKTAHALTTLCKNQDATLFMGLHAAFSVLLSRYSNENDIVVGSPIANREKIEVEDLIGFFVNTLVLRSDLSSAPSFIELLEQSKSTLLEAYAHQQVPFEHLVEHLQPERSLNHGPLFQVMLVLQNNEQGDLSLPGLELKPVEQFGNGLAKFDLLLNVTENDEGLYLHWEFNSDLFDRSSIERLAVHFSLLLNTLAQNAEQSVFSGELCSSEELKDLAEFQTGSELARLNTSVHQVFEEQARNNPEAIALRFQGIELSYGELNRRANRLARYLQQEQGLVPHSLVGLCLDRSIEMIVGILAILKSGCAYVSLDPRYPKERLIYILEDSQLACVLSLNNSPIAEVLPSDKCVYVDSDRVIEQLASSGFSDEDLRLPLGDEDLAYIIYTSGSTGKPKGVAQTHQTLCNLAQAQAESDGITRPLTTLQFASINFDVSIQEIVTAWYTGSALQVISADDKDNLPGLLDLIASKKIERAFLPPAVLHLLVDQYIEARDKNLSLREVFVAGEALLGSANLDAFLESNPQCVLWNHYGPTETHVVTRHRYNIGERRVPIGRILPGFKAQVVNAQGIESPVGIPGELLISGVGLARGYINAEALSAEKFTATAAGSKYPRQYRTGDLVRWLADGKLEYLGRLDQQVKIRGFRIELGELEVCMKAHAEVQDALVTVHKHQSTTELCAYVISIQDAESLRDSLRSHIESLLPSYMLPSSICVLKRWPLTANGKIDKAALPAPDFNHRNAEYFAPSTESEIAICRIWQQALAQERIGTNDNFFELGGHSLSATRVIAKLNQQFNKTLPLKLLFEKQTIRELAAAIEGLDSEHKSVTSVARDKAIVSSFAQRRLWLLEQIEGPNAHYNLANTLRLDGELNRNALTESFQRILQRHESLRTNFSVGENGEPYQVIGWIDDFQIPFDDLSGLAREEQEKNIQDIVRVEANTHFDLSADLMLKVRLIKASDIQHYLVVTLHHIASDGWSFGVLIDEFKQHYSSIIEGKPLRLPDLLVQYADYAAWQRNHLQGEQLEKHLSYWTQTLDGIPEVHALPLDHPRPKQQSFNGRLYRHRLSKPVCNDIKQLCQRENITLFMALNTVFSVLLARHSNERDIVIGSPIANREQSELEPLIGFFVNTLVLRTTIDGNPSFSALLQQSKQNLLNAYEHQQLPFELLVEHLQPVRSLSHSPLFQVMFILQNTEQGRLELPGLELTPFDNGDEQCVAKFDLLLNVQESEDTLELMWEYNSDLFEASSIVTLTQHFEALLESCANDPEQAVLSASFLSPDEESTLLRLSNHFDTAKATDTRADDITHLHQFIERQAELKPDAIAFVCGSERISYREFNTRANRLAHYLQQVRQVKPETLVGVCMHRSLDMVLSIVSVLKAGGAYVPLDPEYPTARLAYMIEDSGLTTVITQHAQIVDSSISQQQALCLDDARVIADLAGMPNGTPVNPELSPQNLAYVIYTSGSTGKPKGVMIEHRNAVAFILWAKSAFTPSQLRNVLASTSMCFDLSIFEFFAPSSVGGSSTIVANILELVAESWSEEISLINTVPSAADMLLATGDIPKSATTINLAGEPLKQSLVDRLYEHGLESVYDLYGPSEDTTYSTYGLREQFGRASIGKPIQNTQAYVLNEALALAPRGTVGELYLGGAGLSRGYLNQVELTRERYIENPFASQENSAEKARLYRTGDIVRWNSQGRLEYLGRIDHQVKIRGFRIELGEIENALLAQAQIKDAVVIAKSLRGEDQQLLAYFVMDSPAKENINAEATVESLKSSLATILPDYMLPSVFIRLDTLPLTPNGKIDKRALPDPKLSELQAEYQAPRNAIEEELAAIWRELLDLEQVGIYHNFFHLGGHSLLATRLAAQIQSHFDVTLPLKTLFATPDLASLANSIARAENSEEHPSLVSVSREQALPVSYSQQRLWLLDQIDGGSAHYNIPSVLRLEGSLDFEAFALAFNTIVERHESLRTVFSADEDGQALQNIQDARAVEIAVYDLSALNDSEQEQQLSQHAIAEASRNFNLREDLMLRVQLLKLSEQEHVVLVTLHHIASDGWSIAVLINEFKALYTAYVTGEASPLEPLAIQYADYAHWQRHWLQGEVLERQLNYWSTQLSGLPVVHNLPLDHARPQQQSFAGKIHSQTLSVEQGNGLKAVCEAQGATLFMGLHAAFASLLSRYSNEHDIVVGSPIANREQNEVSDLIGFFVNTLVLRSDLSASPTFVELLQQSKTTLLDAYAHQQVPFEQVVERLQPQRSLSHSPLFQVMLILQNNEQGDLSLPNLTLQALATETVIAKYDLTLNVIEANGALHLAWEYNSDLFEASSIARMAEHFDRLMSSLLAAPEAKIEHLNFLSETERQRLAFDWNQTDFDYDRELCIHRQIEAQAERTPEACAVIFEEQSLTYAELNQRANQIARYLREEKAIEANSLVGLCVERSLDMLVAMLAILKAGGAYVPLDPDYPQARIAYMLDDAKLKCVLTQMDLLERTPVSEAQALCLDAPDFIQTLTGFSSGNLEYQHLSSEQLAYVIYTSGSTGNPKGVMVRHRNLVNFIASMAQQPGLNKDDCLLAVTSTSFDIHGLEIFLPLIQGAKVVVASRESAAAPESIADLISQHSVSIMQATPATWKMLVEAEWRPSQALKVLCGGEALSENLASAILRCGEIELWNMYGPTETTIWSSTQKIEADQSPIFLGQPIGNTQFYVATPSMDLAPTGVAGELIIGGEGVTQGYLDRVDLTAEKFITNPFNNKRGMAATVYRTGDLVRRLASGDLEFLGRIDHQVKIRGFRIELGEIENTLIAQAEIQDAVVLAKTINDGDQQLVAYVVLDKKTIELLPDNAAGDLTLRIRENIKDKLPAHMLPSLFMVLDALPLTPNGKVDRKALPIPDLSNQSKEYIAPRTELETLLSNIWAELLKVERISVDDNFFLLGGHSLLATRLISKIRSTLNVNLPMKTVFTTDSLESLAVEITELMSNKDNNDNSSSRADFDSYKSVTEKREEQTEELVF